MTGTAGEVLEPTPLFSVLQAHDVEFVIVGGFSLKLDAEGLADGGNYCLLTTYGRLDVMQELPGLNGYTELRASAVEVAMPGVGSPLLFAGYETLLAMKSAAGRTQDILDIAELRHAREEGSR